MTVGRRQIPGGRWGAALAIVAASTLGAGAAGAQGKTTVADRIPGTNPTTNSSGGADLHLFRAAVDSKGFFSVNGADILPGGDISIGLVLDYGHAIMPLAANHGADLMVKHAFKGTVLFDYCIANILVVGIEAPIVLNGGDAAGDIGPGGKKDYDTDSLNAQALGDLALHVKVPLLRPDKPIGIAVVAQAGVGVGGTRNFASEPGFFYWPQAVFEARIGNILRLGLNAGYRGHTGDNAVFGLGRDGKSQLKAGLFEYSGLFTGGFAVSVRPAQVIDLVAETYATYQVGGSSERRERLSAEAMGGVKLFVDKGSFLMVGAGPGYTPGFQTAQVRAMLGFVYEPVLGERARPDSDRDRDGVPDKLDKCPDLPGEKTGRPDDDGCPAPRDGEPGAAPSPADAAPPPEPKP
jgi:hypothetical protein